MNRQTEEALERLVVIDRLVVGPPRVEADRCVTPYVVHQAGAIHETELTYRYEEPVFRPEDPGAHNLAALVGAQVALNYGLFCREIVFRGRYDTHDRRFLEEMARHTAREIYVNKLVQPNPFLTDAARGLPEERLPDFLRARVTFEGAREDDANAGKGPGLDSASQSAPWVSDPSRHAILSSGGKDSLLTYGLLNEIGVETHPIYVNESGRHWYTALNAYRHFQANVPHTARVWTNADRLFTWMLRRLPLVRPDFANVRADIYPIRLWTVAVFLFGALPLLRVRGIGRLLVGDEYDTSVRANWRGITHYAGLYDQSRWFDKGLSRYFQRKGWSVAQFSLLRPLSELLIEKVLSERYPALLRHQVSCHAAHVEGERVHPCGRCEKCRRIVGMLTALGQDPEACGYTPAQIEAALVALMERGVHQEVGCAEHTVHLLAEQGRLPSRPGRGGSGAVRARPHPEVVRLRFDAERSPLDTIPNDLRRPLYERLLQHAAGAVRRSGRVWVEFDPLSDESLVPPYPFEQPRERPATGAGHPLDGREHRLAELTWPEAQARLREVDIALLPVGAIEQHGPHLPLDVDTWDADRLCHEVARACGPPRPLVLPVVPYGVSYHHDDFPGTISLAPDTLAQIVYEIGMSLARQGVTKLVIVNGHGGNAPALHFAAQKINRDAHIFTCVDTGESSDADVEALTETPNDVHAGEVETATTLARRPELVKMSLARSSIPRFSSEYLDFSSRKGVGWYVRTARISESGVLGDPTKATAEKGERVWQVWVKNLVTLVEDIKGMSLDEIHERRY